MSQIQSFFLRGRALRCAGIVSILGVCGVLLGGCVSDVRGPDRNSLTFWGPTTERIVDGWASPGCEGTFEHRARCGMALTQGLICPNLQGILRGVCAEATDPDEHPYGTTQTMWQSFQSAAFAARSATDRCIAIDWGGLGEIREWTTYRVGVRGCR